jgi:hypothetical protein
MNTTITYRTGIDLDLDAVIELYRASMLGERRPVDDRECMRLMRRTQAAAPSAGIILLAAPAAEKYYPHAGFTPHPQAWILRPGQQIKNLFRTKGGFYVFDQNR